MPTRIRRRSALVTDTKVPVQVRQAIADVSRFQKSGEVTIPNSMNPILAANDPNVEVLRLDDNTTYTLGYQSFGNPLAAGGPVTREDLHNHCVWNRVTIRGGRGTEISRSNTNSGADGWFFAAGIFALGGTLPEGFGSHDLVLENITFNCPVAIGSGFGGITIRNCRFTQDYAEVSLLMDDCAGFVVDGCEFEGTHSGTAATITGIRLTGIADGIVSNCRSVGIHPVDVGIDCDITTGAVSITGCNFSNYQYPTAGWECIGYDLTDSGTDHVSCSVYSNRGMVIT